MHVEYPCIDCRPDEAVYLEGLVDRPVRHERLWQLVRNARVTWTDRVIPAGAMEVPLPFRGSPEAQFAFRFAEASRRWQPFAGFEPHPITVELAAPVQLSTIRRLADIALQTAEHHVVNTDQAYAEFQTALGPGINPEEVRQMQAELDITEETLRADLFGRALNEVQMATSIIRAIDQAR